MEQIILDEIEKLEALHNSYVRYSQESKVTEAQIYILRRVLKTYKRKHRIALLKDNQDNYDMGLITPKEYAEKVAEINKM